MRVRQYYFRTNQCSAPSAWDRDCICWHDEGSGPLAGITPENSTWREKPVAVSETATTNAEKRSGSPVAESRQAPAPSEPGDRGVAPAQASALPHAPAAPAGETPRTDAVECWRGSQLTVTADFARTLERELAEAIERCAAWASSKGEILAMYENSQAELAALRSDMERMLDSLSKESSARIAAEDALVVAQHQWTRSKEDGNG